MPFVSGLRSRAATAITAPMIVPYSMDVEAKQCRLNADPQSAAPATVASATTAAARSAMQLREVIRGAGGAGCGGLGRFVGIIPDDWRVATCYAGGKVEGRCGECGL